METISMNSEKNKSTELHKSFLNLLPRLDLESLNEHMVLQNLSVCYTQKD